MVIAYLPSVFNDGVELFHLLHDDKDREDLDLNEIKRGNICCQCKMRILIAYVFVLRYCIV